MSYSLNKIRTNNKDAILGLEVPFRELYRAVAAIIVDHSDKATALQASYGYQEKYGYEAISNLQSQINTDCKAEDVYIGLAMKDVFLSAAIKKAITLEEIRDYVSPAVQSVATVDYLKAIGFPTLAHIVEETSKPLETNTANNPQPV